MARWKGNRLGAENHPVPSDAPLKLHLGCGKQHLDGYVNIDWFDHEAADVLHDLRAPLPYDDGSVDEIWAQHVIEHFGREEAKRILHWWYKTLKPGGRIRLQCPELDFCMRAVLERRPSLFPEEWPNWWIDSIYGGEGPSGAHRYGYTAESLRTLLREIGFVIDETKSFVQDGWNLHVEAIK